MTEIAASFKRQFDRMWKMLSEAIEKCPRDQWKKAPTHPFFVPSRLAYHVIEAVDFYAGDSPEQFTAGERLGVGWRTAELENLASKDATLEYLRDTRREMAARLQNLSDTDFFGPNPFPGRGKNLLELMAYTLRHSQHHLGQLNGELKRRGLQPARWC